MGREWALTHTQIQSLAHTQGDTKIQRVEASGCSEEREVGQGNGAKKNRHAGRHVQIHEYMHTYAFTYRS